MRSTSDHSSEVRTIGSHQQLVRWPEAQTCTAALTVVTTYFKPHNTDEGTLFQTGHRIEDSRS